jgi:hypothetical protein
MKEHVEGIGEVNCMRLEPLPRYIAGVDPGKHTGVGVYDRSEQRILYITTTDFFGVANFLMSYVRISDLRVYVEVPATFMYNRNDGAEDKIRDRKMLLLGGVRREAELLAESLRRQSFDVVEVRPIPEQKWDDRKFRAITKSTRQTNEHERDACRIAFVYANKRKEIY